MQPFKTMNFISALFDTIIGFIRRNPLFCLLLLLIAVGAPSLFGFMLYVVAGIFLVSMISVAVFVWRLRSAQRRMEEEFRNGTGRSTRDARRGSRPEGDVSVHRTVPTPEKKVSDDVGEYVDFEEEHDSDNQKR